MLGTLRTKTFVIQATSISCSSIVRTRNNTSESNNSPFRLTALLLAGTRIFLRYIFVSHFYQKQILLSWLGLRALSRSDTYVQIPPIELMKSLLKPCRHFGRNAMNTSHSENLRKTVSCLASMQIPNELCAFDRAKDTRKIKLVFICLRVPQTCPRSAFFHEPLSNARVKDVTVQADTTKRFIYITGIWMSGKEILGDFK